MLETLLASLLLAAQPLAGLSAEDREDIKCVIVAGEMANSEDKELEAAGSIMMFYFLGKVDGRNRVKVEEALYAVAEQMGEDDNSELLTSCAEQVEQRGNDLSALAEG
jgi:hypothetical protein